MMRQLSRWARLMCRVVMEMGSARAARLLVGVAGAAVLGALLSGAWSVHGQGLEPASLEIHTSGGSAPMQSVQPEVWVTPTFLRISEGGSGRYRIYLRSAPSADVTIVISAGVGVTTYPTKVTFTRTAWRSSQVITVTGVDDLDANDGTATITHEIDAFSASEFLSADVQDVQVKIEDDDDSGISASPARMRIAEGDSGTIDVRLESPPTADVTVSGTISDGQWAAIEPATLTFTSTDWSTPQPFTVTSTDDQRRNFWPERPPLSVTLAGSSSDDNYNGLTGPPVQVEIADDENATGCVMVNPERLYLPENGTATFTVALCSKPVAKAPTDTPYVEMRITAGGDVTTDPAYIRFEESNWASGHTMTVSAGDDSDGANDELTIEIQFSSSSGGVYGGGPGPLASVVTTVIDDDSGGIINPIDITVPEGGQGYYQAAIISEPSGTVTISIASAPGVTLSATRLSISPSNWETPQYVIVSAPDDSVTEDVGLQLVHTIGGSSVEYDVITLPDVMVTVADGGAGPTSFARAEETDGTRLSWGAPPTPLTPGLRTTVYQYEIERSVDNGAFAFVTCVDADSTSLLDDNVDADKTYRYRIRAVYYATDRCAALRDIELTSGTLVDNSAHGVWSDGDTIWVAHEADSKLYAYDLATGAAQADDDITAHSDSTSVPTAIYSDVDGGLWGDATRIWTVTANHFEHINHAEEVGFVPYRKSDGAFLSSEVVQTSGDMRPLGYPGGVDRKQLPEAEAFFGDGSTFWAAGSGRDTLFAYEASTGYRDYGKDILVPNSVCGHDQVVGIWHDASRSLLFLATQCSWEKKLYALDSSDGLENAHHIPVHDVTLPQSHGSVQGFWSDGDIVWVSSNTSGTSTRDKLFAYPLHNNRQYSGWSSPPVVVSVEVEEASITQTEATVTVNVSGANDTDVHMRYALATDPENWTTTSLPGALGVESVEFPLTGLSSDREYNVEASYVSTFPTERTKTTNFTTLSPAIESVGAIAKTQTEATIQAVISAPNGDSKQVHLQYRVKGETAWQSTVPVDTTDAFADFSLSGLTSGTDYELEASLDSGFPADGTVAGKFATDPPSVDSVVASEESQTGAKITVYVTEPNGIARVYIQYRADGEATWETRSETVPLLAASHEFILTDLSSGTRYTIEASFDNTFNDADAKKSDIFSTLPPSADEIKIIEVEQTEALIEVLVTAPNGSDLHLRYRTGTDPWSSRSKPVIPGETSIEFGLRGLTSDRDYEVQASYDSSFPETDVTATATFKTLPPAVYSVIVRDKAQTTANAHVTISAPNGDTKTVRLQYQPSAAPADDWTDAQPATSTDADATIALSSLTEATQYLVEATLASDFTSGVRTTVFSTLGDDPIVEDVFVYDADINQEDATATIVVANAGGTVHEVHLRYRTAGETPGAWSTADLKADTDPNDSDTATIELTSLTAGTQYDVQASLDSTFATGTQQATFTTDEPDPRIVSISATSDSSTKATVRIEIEHPDGSDAYVGYRTTGSPPGSWSAPVTFEADVTSHALILSGLSPSTEYQVTASFSTPFPGAPDPFALVTTLAADRMLRQVTITEIAQIAGGVDAKGTVTVTIDDANNVSRTVYLQYREIPGAGWSHPPLEVDGIDSATLVITTFMVSTNYELQASFDSNFTDPAQVTFWTPDVSDVSVKDTTDQTAKVVVMIDHAGVAEKTVHLRYTPVNQDQVQGSSGTNGGVPGQSTESQTTSGKTNSNTVEIPVSDLLPGQEYLVEASLDDNFERGVETASFTTPGQPGTGGGGDKPGPDATPPVTISGSGSGGGGGGGGGGPPPKPVPSDADFRWNVTRDINSLHGDNGQSTGIWGNGELLWVLENARSGPDLLFVYDLETGERVEDREFEVHSSNRFSHGIWSDGVTMWVADSGRDRLFAYDLESGERLLDLEIELHEDNENPRDIWSNGEVIYVLDSGRDSLFAYDLETGDLLAEYELDKLNRDPRGLWSDGVSLWVSDDNANRLFAYRIDGDKLKRIEDEEFGFLQLLRAGNGDPRGIWSDGGVIYVADDRDDKIYTYNMPDAIDARLESLTLSEIAIGKFWPWRKSYAPILLGGLTDTTVEATAFQEEATVTPAPADIDSDPENGHQADVADKHEISITVTSPDGSRTRVYRVSLRYCLSDLADAGLSDVTFSGGSLDELSACAISLSVDAVYSHADNSWAGLFPSAPEFLSQPFFNRFSEGLPPGQPLIAKRGNAPAVAGPCLSDLADAGLSDVTFSGGSLNELAVCVRSLEVNALYHQAPSGWTAFFPDAPAFLSEPFRDRFRYGLSTGQALVAKRGTDPSGPCLSGLTESRLSLAIFSGGSMDELAACAQSLSVDALYHRSINGWTAFFPDAPSFLSESFRNRFRNGLSTGQALVAKRADAPSPEPVEAPAPVEEPAPEPVEAPDPTPVEEPASEPVEASAPTPDTEPIAVSVETPTISEPCLSGLTEELLSDVTFVGGSLDELAECARGLLVDTIFHRSEYGWAAFFADASLALAQPFRDRFPEGLPAGVSLVARRALN